MHWLEALNCTFKYLLLTGSGQLQIYSSYLSLDFQLLSGSSYLFLARIVVVLASEFESYDAPLFRLSLIENECTCQGHAARIFQGMLVFHFGRLTCGLGAGRRRCWSVVAGALLLEHCCSHAFQLAFFFLFSCIENRNRHNSSNNSTSATRENGVGVEDFGIARLASVVVKLLRCVSSVSSDVSSN